jgi:hypothetical protein
MAPVFCKMLQQLQKGTYRCQIKNTTANSGRGEERRGEESSVVKTNESINVKLAIRHVT